MPCVKLNTAAELNELLNDNSVVIVHYGAKWCKSCVTANSIFEVISDMEEYEDIKFIKIDIDDIDIEDKISSIPLVVNYVNGEEISRVVGITVDKIIESIERVKKC